MRRGANGTLYLTKKFPANIRLSGASLRLDKNCQPGLAKSYRCVLLEEAEVELTAAAEADLDAGTFFAASDGPRPAVDAFATTFVPGVCR